MRMGPPKECPSSSSSSNTPISSEYYDVSVEGSRLSRIVRLDTDQVGIYL